MASPQPTPLHPALGDVISLDFPLPTVERTPVVRPRDAPPQVTTPRHMWIIPNQLQKSMHLPSAGSDIMIRQEYYNILVAVLSSLYRQSRVAQLKRDFPAASVPNDEMEVDVDVEPDHLRIPEDPPDVFEENVFPNPFAHPRHGHFYRRGSALIVAGLPGIGKTLFLSVIFYLRAAAKLPTAYMRSNDTMLVYTGDRLFVLQKPALVGLAVPRDAWVLIDSNAGFLSPPQEVVECNYFIVQTASPRAGRTAWAGKLRGPHQFCLMRPWTLEELFTGSSLQPQVCSGVDIQAFFEKFGGSARHVYQDCQNLLEFDNRVDASALPLDNKVIHRIMTCTSPTVAVDDLVGYMLITAFPLDDKDRREFRLTSPTPYLEEKLLRLFPELVQNPR